LLTLGIGEDSKNDSTVLQTKAHDHQENHPPEYVHKNDPNSILSLGLDAGEDIEPTNQKHTAKDDLMMIPKEPQIQTIPSTSVTAGLLDLDI